MRRTQGFTLIEVLVALAILALTLGITYWAANEGLARQGRASRHAIANALARALMDEVGVSRPITPGVTRGEEGGFEWAIEIVADPSIEPPPNSSALAYAVQISVFAEGRGGTPEAAMHTMKLGSSAP